MVPSPDDSSSGEKSRRQAFQFYGRRKGRPLRRGRLALFEDLLPRLRVPLEAGAALDPAALFAPPPRAVWLEIGFGGGEHLAHQAAANPDVGFIGCEVFESGIASALAHIETAKLGNVRIHPEDARQLLAVLKPGALERVFLLFPDPWPKRRHAQRRFVNRGNLDRLAELIAPGGELRIASDDPTYIEWTLRHVPVHPAFRWTALSQQDWLQRPADAIETRYEKKAREEGRTPMFFRFKRV
ncbi:MAG TPA: tRNA (guanosine(46)-N7)-methyltransferase TrmB [Candidatus Cybelea sp.]|nr:tRNA (guanosine(46)-N7)-methyltransferase TrmB [Candidatus Cybelea sp.]